MGVRFDRVDPGRLQRWRSQQLAADRRAASRWLTVGLGPTPSFTPAPPLETKTKTPSSFVKTTGRGTDVEWQQTIDASKALGKTLGGINTLRAVEPTNLAAERERFFASATYEPAFTYAPLEPERVAAALAALGAIETPPTALGLAVQRKVARAKHKLRIAANPGDETVVRTATRAIYGAPSKSLVEAAERILAEIPPAKETGERLSSKKTLQAFRDELTRLGVEGWKVVRSDVASTNVNPTRRKVTVAKNKRVTQATIDRLCVHEIGVHVLRGANGDKQPLSIMRTGLLGYEATEEGLATYRELATGRLDPNTLRKYAARVLAVDAMLAGKSFRETFDLVNRHGFGDAQSFLLAMRAHRGGGYAKDHIYLEGLLDVIRYAEGGGDLSLLYAGKIRTADAPWVAGLIREGVFVAPTLLPEDLATADPRAQRFYGLLEELSRTPQQAPRQRAPERSGRSTGGVDRRRGRLFKGA